MTIDETQGSDRELEAADEEPQPRTDVGAQWTAWQLAEHYNLCMRVNGADDLLPFTWREIMMLDGYGRDGIELRCLDDVDQYPEKFGPNTKVDKKRVKSTLKKSKDPRGGYIEASKAKIEEFLSPAASADESSDVTDDDSFVEPVLLVEPEPEGDDGEDLEVEDVDDLGVGEYLEELIARDWSAIDTWLQERVEQFKERNFDPKEPNDAVSALRIEIADLEVEFARLVLFELAAPNGRLFPDYRSKLRQTFLLEELLKHDERYLEIISSGEQADVDNLSFRTGQAARALTYGNRRLNEDDDIEGRDELPIVSFVDERRSTVEGATADTSNSDEPEETPPTTSEAPEPAIDVVTVTDVQPPAPEPVVSIADDSTEPEQPEAPVAEDEPELDLVQVDLSDTSNSDEPEETPPTTPDEPEPAIDVAIVTVTDVQPPAPEPVVSIADVSSEPEQPEAPVAEDEPELEDVVDDDSELLAELEGLLTRSRARAAAMAEMGFTA